MALNTVNEFNEDHISKQSKVIKELRRHILFVINDLDSFGFADEFTTTRAMQLKDMLKNVLKETE
jgi:hypothetical protein